MTIPRARRCGPIRTSSAGHWALLGFGYWAIEEKATGAFVGEIGFADFKRDLDPALRGIPEGGWVVTRAQHGKGFGTEAARAIVAWSDMRAVEETICLVDPRNAASIRLAEKCGYREARRLEANGLPTILFVRPCAHGPALGPTA
ncbi:MAG: GNAT family protein [Candidatus Velthaea sp.]